MMIGAAHEPRRVIGDAGKADVIDAGDAIEHPGGGDVFVSRRESQGHLH